LGFSFGGDYVQYLLLRGRYYERYLFNSNGSLARQSGSGQLGVQLMTASDRTDQTSSHFINGLAIGVVLIGVFTPITRAAYDPAMKGDVFLFMALSAGVCLCLGLSFITMQHAI
jgi:hypothetical protein